MRLMVVLSIANIVLCQLEEYNYQYITGNIHRNEMRFPNGTVIGNYKFIDDNNFTHDVKYISGVGVDFKIDSHKVTGNGQTIYLNTNYIHEITAARDAHNVFQNYLRKFLPQLTEEDLPPIYIRHVPSPIKEEPVVPIIPVIPPQKVSQQNIKNIHETYQQHFEETKRGPSKFMLGSRALLYTDNLPAHILVKTEEIPLQYNEKSQTEIPSKPHIVPSQYPDRINTIEKSALNSPISKFQHLSQIAQYPKISAQNIQLVNGFTPEVAKATEEHLTYVAAIRALLPELEE